MKNAEPPQTPTQTNLLNVFTSQQHTTQDQQHTQNNDKSATIEIITCTYNPEHLAGLRRHELIHSMEQQGIDILILNGTTDKYNVDITTTPNRQTKNDKYIIYNETCGDTPSELKAGISLCLGPKLHEFRISKMQIQPHRILGILAQHKEFEFLIIGAYAHQEHTDHKIRQQFRRALAKSITSTPKHIH